MAETTGSLQLPIYCRIHDKWDTICLLCSSGALVQARAALACLAGVGFLPGVCLSSSPLPFAVTVTACCDCPLSLPHFFSAA